MKVLAILALVQIAVTGILGAVISEQPNEIEDEPVNEAIEMFRSILSDIGNDTEIARYIDMSESARLKCETNGGSKAFSTVINSAQIALNSVINTFNTTLLQLEAVVEEPSNNALSYSIDTLCQLITNMNEVIKSFTKSIRLCWTEAERNSANRIIRTSKRVLRYVCPNRGNRNSEFFNADFIMCLASNFKNNEIQYCANTHFTGNATFIESVDETVNPPWSFPVIVPNIGICREVENFQRCIVAVIRGCGRSRSSNKINSVFHIVKDSIGCESLLHPEASHPRQ